MFNKTTPETNPLQWEEIKISRLNELRAEFFRLNQYHLNPFEIDINQLARTLEDRGLIERQGVIQPHEKRRAYEVLIRYVGGIAAEIETLEWELGY